MSTVLVVDDERSITDLLALFLADQGHESIRAGHGREALDALQKSRVDIVLSDLMMPVMDGAGLLQGLRRSPRHMRLPFILMCAFPEAAIADRIRGYDAFIRKPFALDTMASLVERELARARQRLARQAPIVESRSSMA